MQAETYLSFGQIAFRIAVILLLVLANGFFVAAEFALVGARRTRIEALARMGNRSARLARSAIRRLDHYISGTQLGITLASIGLGWVGESTLAALLIDAFEHVPAPWSVIATHAVATAIAFAVITFLHIVLGELAPKSVALLFPETTSLWTAAPLIAFAKVLTPFIWFLNGSANLLLKLIGLRPATEVERVHRPSEIEMLVTQSYQHGLIREEPVEMIRGVFDLSEMTAAEVMTPRTEVVGLPVESTIEESAIVFIESGHSRIPVYEGTIDRIVGVVLARDVWDAERRGEETIEGLARPVRFVPASKPIESLLREMQSERVHLVIVVDEYGGTAGITTIEDLVEEIVGEIQDENEEEPPEIEETETGEVLLDGSVPVTELNDLYHLGLPAEDFTTAGGFVMGQLGRIPEEGEEVAFSGGRFRIVTMEGRRVERLGLTIRQGREKEPPESP